MSQVLKIETDYHADSVEWCPLEDLEHILACGLYQLNEKNNVREGSFSLFKWDNVRLSRIFCEECKAVKSGVLDIKWKLLAESCALSLATAEGKVELFHLSCEDGKMSLRSLGHSSSEELASEKDKLCLSLDWSKASSPSLVAASDSKGQVSVMKLEPTGLRPMRHWQAHSYEAWIVGFGHDASDIFSGGDDCQLHRWDLRSDSDRPVATTKWHNMGVCSLQSHPSDCNLLASGSYDEHMAVWDVRNLSHPLKHVSLGGGVWRVKWNTALTDLVAAACMHNNFCVVDTHLATSDPMGVACQYKEHSSLAYGVDWCRRHEKVTEGEQDMRRFTLASCSFYDNSLHVWTAAMRTRV